MRRKLIRDITLSFSKERKKKGTYAEFAPNGPIIDYNLLPESNFKA